MKPELPNRIEECKGIYCKRCNGQGACGSTPVPTKEQSVERLCRISIEEGLIK